MFLLAMAVSMAACQSAQKDSTEKADSTNNKYDYINNIETGTGDIAISGPDASKLITREISKVIIMI